MKTFVVLVSECDRGSPKVHRRYLGAVFYQPNKYGDSSRYLSIDPDEAFKFTQRAAAEVIAAMVGGDVVGTLEALEETKGERSNDDDEG